MTLVHPVSKEPQVAAFARANPLPKTAEGMADALMDMATILIACQPGSSHWDSVELTLAYTGRANPYPGAFLSNPAMLPNTVTVYPGGLGRSMGSLTAGCLFGYSHYQEDSLGVALLMTAFSPRKQKPQRKAALYAKALILLRDRGWIDGARLGYENGLEKAASGETPESDLKHCFFGMKLGAAQIAASDALRTDLAARAIELALTDDKHGLFTDATRARLLSLALGRSAPKPAPDAVGAAEPPRRPRI